jgi:hypothetical protein
MDFSRAGMLTRLKTSLEREYAALGKLRKQRSRLVSIAAGPNYPHAANEDGWLPDGTNLDILGLLRQAAQAQAISLAAERPRFMCSSPYVDRLAFSTHFENALNAYAKTMKLELALFSCAENAFFGLGIAKVYMAQSVPVLLEENEWMDPGKPFVQSISPHHFVYDTQATSFENCSFLADRYRVSFNDLCNDTRFKASFRKELKRIGPLTSSQLEGEEWGKALSFDESELDQMVFLSDVFIPREGKVYTYLVDEAFRILIDEPLAEVTWTGAETGPYKFLNLGPVSDKTTPSSPAQNLELLHNLINTLYRTLSRQAKQQRTIVQIPTSTDEAEVKAAREANDLAFLRSDAVIGLTRIGGPDQNVFAYVLNAMSQYSRMANNLDVQLGLGAVTDTVGQEGIVAQGVSRSEGYIQGRFASFVREIAAELGRLLFTSKTTSFPMVRQLDSYISVDDPWKGAVEEGSRLGDYYDYDIDIDPYSMAYKSPAQKVTELKQTFMELVPLAPLTMQQGTMPDVQYYLKELSRLLNNPCLERLLVSVVPPEEQQGGGHERTLAPQSGPREYIHRSDGGGRGGDQGQQQLQMMSAASANNAA